ncbi:hypothetical protein AHiyo8_13660 [Arthrobacter sp. Hiyo8]|nr:hypothetical protein AHiyo8_13660 [Arthrobacter sp. Hiyo8]
MLGGGVEHLLHPVHVRGEGGNDDPLLGLAEQTVQGGADLLFRRGEAGNIRVGGVGHEQVHPFFTQAGEVAQVRDAAIEGQLVHLEVARVQDVAAGSADEDGQGIRNGVVDGNEFAFEGAELLHLPFGDRQRVRLDPVFLELGLDEGKRQLGTDQRQVRAQAQKIRHSADVVFVAVRQDDGNYVVQPVLDVREIGQDQVDTRLCLFREEHAAVNHQQLAVDFENGHVAADLPSPPRGTIRSVPCGSLGGVTSPGRAVWVIMRYFPAESF